MSEQQLYADIEWRDDGQPLSRTFDDIYFSSASGLEESRYVFLQQNDLPNRWAQLTGRTTFTIGETGFGTGLNFLAAWQLWQETAPASAHLHFVSVEKQPLHPRDLPRALQLWPQLQPLTEQLLQQYPLLPAKGVHRLHFGHVSLTLVIGEASEAFNSLRLEDDHRDRLVDAWFLDGFAPAKNPEMWTEELFKTIAALSLPEASFATFTSAGPVKRGLKAAGFSVMKVPGYGHKREMLCGRLEQTQAPAVTNTPWHLPGKPLKPARVAIIGAGIAGASTARTLAERGIQIQVFEKGPQPGSGASGNEQGILYAKLSPKPGPNGDFNLHALMFAQRYYRNYCPEAAHFCGQLQLAQKEKDRQLQQQLIPWLEQNDAENLARTVDASEASAIAGLNLEFDALYFPSSGWLESQKACATLLQHKNIALHCSTPIDELQPLENGWLLRGSTGEEFTADAVIICTANDMANFAQTEPLPLRPIRGQISGAVSGEQSQKLKVALCGKGALAPAFQGRHHFGSTFKLRETETALREEENRENLENLERMQPQIAAEFSKHPLTGRAALRAATPDYLPAAGPLPEWQSLTQTYVALAKNCKQLIAQTTPYQANLFALGGLGARGFAYAPLAAEVLAAWLCNEPMPVSNDLVKALHPARFAIRALGKNLES